MQSDILYRHMKQHEKEKYETEFFFGSIIGSNGASLQEETQSEFSSVSTNTSTPINEEFVIKSMVIDSDEYNKKMELGKIVAKTVVEKKIPQDSLSSIYKDALYLLGNKAPFGGLSLKRVFLIFFNVVLKYV